MKVWQKVKKFLFHLNMLRTQNSQLGAVATQFLLIIQALQIASIFAMLPLTTKDPLSSFLYQLLRLFALPSLLQVLTIPRYAALLGIVPLLVINFLLTGFYLLKQKQDLKTHWFTTYFFKFSQIYQKLFFIPFLQLAMSEILQTANTTIPAECSTDLCKTATIVLGSILLGLSVWLYYQFLYINIPCYFDDGIETDNTHSMLNAVRGGKLVLAIGLAASGINSYVVFAIWGVCYALDSGAFVLIGYQSDPKIEKTCTIIKGFHLTNYVILLLSNILELNYRNYTSMLVALLFPITTKLFWNFKEILKNRVNVQIAQGLQGNEAGIDRYLRTLYAEHKRNNSKVPKGLALLSKNIITGTLDKSKETNDLQASAYQEAMDHQMIEFIENTYSSLFAQQSVKKMNLSIVLSWVLFLKDVKKSYIHAYIVLTQMRKTLQSEGSFRTRLQFEMIEKMVELEIGAGADEKTISANKIFTFLDDAHSAQLQIEDYLSKILQYYSMMYSPIVKASEVKSQGQKLLLARGKIMKKLEQLTEENRAHRQTIQLYTFFIKAIVEEKSRSKIFELNRKLLMNNYARSDGLDLDVQWDMTLEFYSNALSDNSGNHVAVLNLNSSDLGQIVRLSDNLMSLLGFAKPDLTSLSLSSLELTLFNRKNLKTLQELLLEGDNPFEKVPEREKVLYLKSKSGRVFAFHYAAHLEIYDGNPCLVLYLKVEHNAENNFVIFNLRKEGKIIGVGEGISTMLGEQWNKFSSVYDMIPEFPRDFNEASHPVFMHGVPLNFFRSKTLLPGGVFYDYAASVHHLSIIGKSYGVLLLSTSFVNRSGQKSQLKMSEIRESRASATSQVLRKRTRISGNEPTSSTNLLLFQENRTFYPSKDSVRPSALHNLMMNEQHYPYVETSDMTKVSLDKEHMTKPISVKPLSVDKGDEGSSMKGTDEVDKNTEEVTPGLSPERRALRLTVMTKEESQQFLPSSTDNHKDNSERRIKRMLFENAGESSKASSVTAGAHLTFLRYAILERGDPAVIKTVYFSSAVIFVTAIICTIFTNRLLTDEYTTFSGFATHAAFPAILKLASCSFFYATQLYYGMEIDQFTEASLPFWRSTASTIAGKRLVEFTSTVSEHLVNFNPETLSSNLKISNYSMEVKFPESNAFDRNVSFYEANNIFLSYAKQISLLPMTATTIDKNILAFVRNFNIRYQEVFLDSIAEILFTDAYNKYYSILSVLDYILIGCSLLTLILTLGFFFVFRKFEQMETVAISKLCAVSKDEMDREVIKIIEEYRMKFNPSLQLSSLIESQKKKPTKDKTHGSHRTTRAGRKMIGDHTSSFFIIFLLVLAALLLSGGFFVVNVVFKGKTQMILPYLTDIDKLSAGMSAYPIAYSSFLRLANAIKKEQSDSSFEYLYSVYQRIFNNAYKLHEELLPRLRNFEDRILSTDLTSNETKKRYQNLTDDSFCADRDQNGTAQAIIGFCLKASKNLASQGLPETAVAVMKMDMDFIQQLNQTPTVETVTALLQAPDSWDPNFFASVLANVLQYMLQSEQIDVSIYAESLLNVTGVMLAVSLIYNVVITMAIWIPIIIYLKKRFWLARNIFLLYPIRVLYCNEHIKQLFKKW